MAGRPAIRHGWSLHLHPLFDAQRAGLIELAAERHRHEPETWREARATKLLAAVEHIILELVPRNPVSPAFLLGNTLGAEHRQWRRVKFSGRYRLFFRFSSEARAIAYVWMNDETTLGKAAARSDPYHVFRQMLARGEVPEDLASLLKQSRPPALEEEI